MPEIGSQPAIQDESTEQVPADWPLAIYRRIDVCSYCRMLPTEFGWSCATCLPMSSVTCLLGNHDWLTYEYTLSGRSETVERAHGLCSRQFSGGEDAKRSTRTLELSDSFQYWHFPRLQLSRSDHILKNEVTPCREYHVRCCYQTSIISLTARFPVCGKVLLETRLHCFVYYNTVRLRRCLHKLHIHPHSTQYYYQASMSKQL